MLWVRLRPTSCSLFGGNSSERKFLSILQSQAKCHGPPGGAAGSSSGALAQSRQGRLPARAHSLCKGSHSPLSWGVRQAECFGYLGASSGIRRAGVSSVSWAVSRIRGPGCPRRPVCCSPRPRPPQGCAAPASWTREEEAGLLGGSGPHSCTAGSAALFSSLSPRTRSQTWTCLSSLRCATLVEG